MLLLEAIKKVEIVILGVSRISDNFILIIKPRQLAGFFVFPYLLLHLFIMNDKQKILKCG